MTPHDYDLAILGSGGAGFGAAIAARRRGLRVVMVERATIGGTCVNVGCIPSKAMLAAAEARHAAASRGFPGVTTSAEPADMVAVVAAKDEIVAGLRRDKYVDIAVVHGFEILAGDARFGPGPSLDVDGRRISASHYLVATGSEPDLPAVPGLRESRPLTSTTAMELDRVPESLIVVGGGYVGLEMAQLFAHLGSRVTVLVRSVLARGEEPEMRAVIAAVFAGDGIEVAEGVVPEAVRREGGEVVVTAAGREHRASELLVATGRRPRTAGLGLEAVGVELGPGGEVVVDATLATSHPRIWAAGDVTNHPQFVYVAARHGGLMVENAFDRAGRELDYAALPRITFTSPALASAGLTEAQAAAAGLDCESRVLGLEHVPRAIVRRDTRGVVKLVAERATGRLVGAHLAGDGAGDVIMAASLAIGQRMSVDDLAAGWNPYLTLGEALHLAAQSFRRDPATLSCCAA